MKYVIATILKFVFSLLNNRYERNRRLCVNLIAFAIVSLFGYGLKQLGVLILIYMGNLALLMLIRLYVYNRRYVYLLSSFILVVNVCLMIVYQIFLEEYFVDSKLFSINSEFNFLSIKGAWVLLEFDKKRHNFIDVLNYYFFIPGFMTGPNYSFNTYLQANVSDINIRWRILKALTTTWMCGILHLISTFINFKDLIRNSESLLKLLVILVIYSFFIRTKYYFVWLNSHACILCYNIDRLNVRISKIEKPTSIRFISQNWNISYNLYFKEFIFKPMFLLSNNKTVSAFTCYGVSALFHSIMPFDIVFFLLCAVISYYQPLIETDTYFDILTTILFIIIISPFKSLEDVRFCFKYIFMKSLMFLTSYLLFCGFVKKYQIKTRLISFYNKLIIRKE
ncbi:hypothetical protein A0H76_1731 [Hepatospora eriocheir]|uniref:ALE1 n=1 Tax=Hepatospora eriocheir TaxID=1081669 RepID=A0A1X0QKH0_9MICR|nr:hypothetical protein A0H76_1731 [Hepatospora eriocheir]